MERISSRQNALVKRFRALARTPRAAPDPTGSSGHAHEVLLDGEHLIQEALSCNVPVDVAVFSDTQLAARDSPGASLATDVTTRGGRVVCAADEVLAAMSPVRHPSGVIAIARLRAADIGAVVSAVSYLPLVLVLAGLQDPGNVGAIVRAAAAFGASGVVAIEGSANPFGWKALRGAMGGTFRIPIAACGTLPDLVTEMRRRRVRLVAAVPRGGTPLPSLNLRDPAAIVLGGEGAGLSAAALADMDETVTIPMHAPVESLNVAMAAALILYEAARQRV